MQQPLKNNKVNAPSVLTLQELELLDTLDRWVSARFKVAMVIREIYSADHRPKVESTVTLALMQAIKDVKDFYKLP